MRINRLEFITKDTEYNEKFYTVSGQEAYLDDDGFPRSITDNDSVCAKAIKNKLNKKFNADNQYRFYIKTDPNKNIFNPIQIHSAIKEKNNRTFINKICKTETVFTEVTQNIFDQYINFLKSKNTHWLDSAQRELK